MTNSNINNKRIFKNTLFLYFRMFIILIVSLYTSRIVLKTLGEVDYGIYNVVGGIVTMLTFLNNSMASASQRFFAYEIGANNASRLKQTFSSSVFLFLIFSLICLLLAETIGLWFVCNKLNIPVERYNVAIFVYQFSVFALILSIIRIPYNALIIAHEHMDFYAKVSILEVSLKLAIVYILVTLNSIDKLKLYSALMFTVITLITVVYIVYSRLYFKESKFTFNNLNLEVNKSILSFSGWNLFGSLSNMLMDQGVNILLNIFFGPVINAARGIAYQIKSQVMSFVGGFQTAANPQIIKYYSSGEIDEMKKLLFRSSKISYFLLLLISLPLYLEMEQILTWWLQDYPQWTNIFARLVLLIILVDSLSGCIIPAIQATSKIKWYQIKVGLTKLFNLPITYILFKMGFPPTYAMIVSIVLNFICLFVRLGELKKHLKIGYNEYFKNVLLYDVIVTIVSLIIPCSINIFADHDIVGFILVFTCSIISTLLAIIFIGLSKQERKSVFSIIKSKISK